MEVLQYSDLDISRVRDAFERAVGHLRAGDFRAADVKKLGLKQASERVQMTAQESSREDWEREARRLELQGKQEQAELIRKELLGAQPVRDPLYSESARTAWRLAVGSFLDNRSCQDWAYSGRRLRHNCIRVNHRLQR